MSVTNFQNVLYAMERKTMKLKNVAKIVAL